MASSFPILLYFPQLHNDSLDYSPFQNTLGAGRVHGWARKGMVE